MDKCAEKLKAKLMTVLVFSFQQMAPILFPDHCQLNRSGAPEYHKCLKTQESLPFSFALSECEIWTKKAAD